ncbi:hypothetical protein SMMN14_01582 [Sphaerulina musiva]
MGTTIMLLMTREYSVHGGANGPKVDCKGVVPSRYEQVKVEPLPTSDAFLSPTLHSTSLEQLSSLSPAASLQHNNITSPYNEPPDTKTSIDTYPSSFRAQQHQQHHDACTTTLYCYHKTAIMKGNITIFVIIIVLFILLALIGFGIYWAQTSVSGAGSSVRGGSTTTSGDEV